MDGGTADAEGGVRYSLINKKFLHSNSTSHEWMFGAIAELLDNACDPDVMASQMWIDQKVIHNRQCLILTDNGQGMDTEQLHRMLSFGFSDKQELNGVMPIGRYGNGFKSGSMRLGKDALVFTRQNKDTMSVGMLSQTYLEKTKASTVVVPMVTWDVLTYKVEYPTGDNRRSLDDILQYSLFKTEQELFDELFAIPQRKNLHQGTRIIIYNLAKDEYGKLELDFKSDPYDIRITTTRSESQKFTDSKNNSVSLYRLSLRKYISILYLRPRMQVHLLGKKVKCICMSKQLTNKKQAQYTPKRISNDPVKIEFGLNPEKDEYGFVIYHRNRLIQAFKKCNFQKRELPPGIEYNQVREVLDQTIGVVELNCITPNHIKQGFQDDSIYRNIDLALSQRLFDYCVSLIEEREEQKRAGIPLEDQKDLWVQCDEPECQKWRRLPFGTHKESLPTVWYCKYNILDPGHNSCDCPEEEEDEPEFQKKKKKSIAPLTPIQSPPPASINRQSSVTPSTNRQSPAKQTLPEDTQPVNTQSNDPLMANVLQGLRGMLNDTSNSPGPEKRKRKRTFDGNKRQCTQNGSSNDSDNENDATPKPKNINTVNRPASQLQQQTPKNINPLTIIKRDDSTIRELNELRNRVHDLEEQMTVKNARISELEQQLEQKQNIENDSQDVVLIEPTMEERFRHVEDLFVRYLGHVWPSYTPNRNRIEDDIQFLLNQVQSLQE